MAETLFGYPLDDNGDIRFMQVYSDYEVDNFEAYKELFKRLHMIALENPGFMPILVLNGSQDGRK